MLFAALGLHALLLFAPLPSEQKLKKPDDQENPVKITQLPTAKPAVKPRPKLVKPALPKLNRPRPAAVTAPVPKAPAKPTASSPTGATDSAKDPFADFPHYQGSTPNCYGKTDLGENCREASVSLSSLVSYFEKALPDKKFTSVPVGGGSSRVKIFQVSKGGKSLYLSVLSDGDSKTVYLLAPESIDSLDKLKKAEGTPKAIADLYDQVADAGQGTNDATPGDFKQPDAYYKDPTAILPEQLGAIYGSPKLVDGSTDDQVYAALKTYLTKSGYSAEPAGSYGGGPLYEIKDASFTGYLNLAPSKTGGPIVVVWIKKPE